MAVLHLPTKFDANVTFIFNPELLTFSDIQDDGRRHLGFFML